jgi:hypothetical protein
MVPFNSKSFTFLYSFPLTIERHVKLYFSCLVYVQAISLPLEEQT